MSHFTEVKTQIQNKDFLIQALKKAGYTVIENKDTKVDVRGFMGDTLPADFKILTKSHYDIGFIQNKQGFYELVGDWELLPVVANIEKDSFIEFVKKKYALEVITIKAQELGLTLSDAIEDENGQIQIIAQKNYY